MTGYAPSRNMVSSVAAACKAEASSCVKMPAYSAILVLFLDAILVASIFLALGLMILVLALGVILALAAVLAGAGIWNPFASEHPGCRRVSACK